MVVSSVSAQSQSHSTLRTSGCWVRCQSWLRTNQSQSIGRPQTPESHRRRSPTLLGLPTNRPHRSWPASMQQTYQHPSMSIAKLATPTRSMVVASAGRKGTNRAKKKTAIFGLSTEMAIPSTKPRRPALPHGSCPPGRHAEGRPHPSTTSTVHRPLQCRDKPGTSSSTPCQTPLRMHINHSQTVADARENPRSRPPSTVFLTTTAKLGPGDMAPATHRCNRKPSRCIHGHYNPRLHSGRRVWHPTRPVQGLPGAGGPRADDHPRKVIAGMVGAEQGIAGQVIDHDSALSTTAVLRPA